MVCDPCLIQRCFLSILWARRYSMYFSYLETVVRLSFSWLCSPVSCQTDNSSPLWGTLGSLWSVRVPLAQQAELAPQPAKLNPPCLSVQTAVMFPFDLLSHWNCRWYFAELFWYLWGIMCFWYEKDEHRFLLQLLFTGDLSEMGKKKKSVLSDNKGQNMKANF